MLGLLSAFILLTSAGTPDVQVAAPALLPPEPGTGDVVPAAPGLAPVAPSPPPDAAASAILVVEPGTPSANPVAPPSPGTPPPLPPGWNYGALLDRDGNRWIVPVPPGMALPPLTTRTDLLEQARMRLEMLRVALDGYFDSAISGANEYPRADTLADLTELLKRSEFLPEGWKIEGQLVDFQLSPYGYRIGLVVADHELVITSTEPRNPYRMVLVLPHPP